jgi:hypothetical protein
MTMSLGRANGRRGEIEAVIDGERKILCLTLGAIAELETALGVDTIAELAMMLGRGGLSAASLIALIGAGLRGGGNRISDEEVRDCHVEGGVEGAVRLAVRLMATAFGQRPREPEGADDPARP